MSTEFGSARDAFLAELRAQREKLDKLIAEIESLGPSQGGAAAVSPGGTQVQVGRHEFVGMSTPEAVKRYLGKTRQLEGPRAIAQALVQGGFGDDPETVYQNVYSALKRLRASGEAVKHRAEWGLAEHWPNLAKRDQAAKQRGETVAGDAVPPQDEGTTSAA